MSKISLHRRNVTSFKNFHAPRQATGDFVFSFLSGLDTPRSLAVWLLYSSQSREDHQQLTGLECNANNYCDAFKFRDDYAATKLLSKAKFLSTGYDLKKVAMTKFFEFEEQCRQTNKRFRNLALDPTFIGSNCELLEATRRKIAQVLGTFSAEELFEEGNWGPGVTTLLKGSRVSAINKFHLENGITRDLYALVGSCFAAAYPPWDCHLTGLYGQEKRWSMEIGNRVVTVPKDSKTDRVIAIEPGINLWFQKSVGSMIRRRLKRFSIDLNTQTINQVAARQGSRDLDLATIDFSSASDSISLELVRYLLPDRWFQLMDACRSKFGVHTNEACWWEKFSSMGNGFTFELESLIFFCAAKAVTEKVKPENSFISVYGDDVIISSQCVDLYSSYCKFLGFTVNLKKSCFSGYFRESCGSYWWDGIDCKPIFLKERVQNVSSIYKLANSVRNFAHRRNNYYGCDRRLLHSWRSLCTWLPKPLRLRTPSTLGDVGLSSNFDESTPSKAKHGIEGYCALALTEVGLADYLDSPAVLLARLKQPSVSEMNNSYTLRGRTKLRLTTVLVSQWYNFGPWL